MADLNSMLYDVKRLAQHRVELSDEKIKSIYEQLMTDLDGFLASTYRKYSDSDGRLYLNYLDEHRQRAAFLQQIVDNVDNITPTLKNEMQSLIDATYEECYKGMADSVKAAYTSAEVAELLQDIDVNPQTMQAAVNNNISKLTLPSVMEAHRAQIIYQIQRELTIGLVNGDRYETMSKRISERVGVSQSKAMNITRTETHRNVESGFMDCAEHIQEGLEGSGLIYAATWRTMKDERVRPQQRRKTKSGWKTTWSKNGANHMKMEGQTVKVGEMFNLGNGVKTKAPGQSGVAAHDCQCRCFLEYNLMTVEEFAKATGQTENAVRKKYNIWQQLTEDEAGSIRRYISSDSYKINFSLRENLRLTEMQEEMKNNLDSALRKLPKYSGAVTRSLDFMNEQDVENFLKAHREGETILNKSYISATKSKDGLYNPDGQVQMLIESVNARDISTFNRAEDEVLFERNSKFAIISVVRRNGKIYIKAKEIV